MVRGIGARMNRNTKVKKVMKVLRSRKEQVQCKPKTMTSDTASDLPNKVNTLITLAQHMETVHKVTGETLCCTYCVHPYLFGMLREHGNQCLCKLNDPTEYGCARWCESYKYGAYCQCCLTNMVETDYVWRCECTVMCISCGAELALRGIVKLDADNLYSSQESSSWSRGGYFLAYLVHPPPMRDNS